MAETLVLLADGDSDALEDVHRRMAQTTTRVMQRFGPSILIVEASPDALADLRQLPGVLGVYTEEPVDHRDFYASDAERLGLEGWNLRHSERFRQRKAHRPREGEPWVANDEGDGL